MTDLLDRVRGWVTREPSLPAVLDRVAGALTGALAADGCLVFLVDDDGDLVLGAGHPAPGEPGLRLPRGFGVTGRVAADGIPVVLVDDQPRNPRHRELLGLGAGDPVSRLCVPARVPDGGCVAVLAVFSRRRRAFGADEVDTAQAVADLVALRVHLSALAEAVDGYRNLRDRAVADTVFLQEAERRRIAGDLHDGVTQAIASLSFRLSAARTALRDGDIGDVARQVDAAASLADLAFGETRSAITGLSSPILDDLGLPAGLASLARNVPNLPIRVDAQDLSLPDHVTTSLFRVAQEAIHNIVRHADASRAVVRLGRHGRTALLTVTDDGRGFEPAAGESCRVHPGGAPRGLRGMAERVRLLGGELRVRSRRDEGTTIEVRIPDVL
ncbi:GAF domain-containing protein [Amorphoplanes digitatis]|uniref:histidine kinase n=1 Tax=Actinoplanes digitatis TaxID=1868 RepID=A0A7W7I0C6_9ACTN|nr:GAF domain-containing sensor histidine kinase [Actinoplanes digitatis]MBB4764041.1 signal transduction histidine kinase [Actinoplanes digitatis]GID93861.1 sensor histidine kinase [Actinoplanes digitatis]